MAEATLAVLVVVLIVLFRVLRRIFRVEHRLNGFSTDFLSRIADDVLYRRVRILYIVVCIGNKKDMARGTRNRVARRSGSKFD